MKRVVVSVVALIVVLVLAVSAAAAVNAGFEFGNLVGWASINGGSGEWSPNDGSTLHESGAPSRAPAEGKWQAVFDQNDPSFGVLYQDIVVPDDGIVSFDLAYTNYADVWQKNGSDPYDLSVPVNQWLSVDVLIPGADPKTTTPSDIIATPFSSDTAPPTSSGWQTYSVKLSGWEQKTVRLRFAAVDALFYMSVFVDGTQGTQPYDPGRTPDDIAYCTVAGDTWPDGTVIPPGTFVTLQVGQVTSDPHYAGAQVANYVYGMGLTCDQVPIGYTHQGFAYTPSGEVPFGIYPFWGPPGTGHS